MDHPGKKHLISQEALKLIACVTMLLDHIGATVVYDLFQLAAAADGENTGALLQLYNALRFIGRLSFPIYCFLLAEGAHHTHDPKHYALRLGIAALISEIPFDLTFFGALTLQHQNVMFTLLLGFLALKAMEKCPNILWKLLAALPFLLLAKWMRTDYGANGVLAIVLFGLTREAPCRRFLQFLGLWFVFSPGHRMMLSWVSGISITLQEWAVLAMLPISLYSGRKRTDRKAVQWTFYLFYPAHLLMLYGIGRLL